MGSKSDFRIAVVGATGAVGKQLLSILAERKFPVDEVIAFASSRSKGSKVGFAGRDLSCRVLEPGCFRGVDFAFFDASDAVSREWVMPAAQEAAWVIDNSAVYRMDPDVPLLVPEVNGHLLEDRLRRGSAALAPKERILSGPNCSTVQMAVALKPLQDRFGLKRVVVSTYQSVSGAGAAAMLELSAQTQAALSGTPLPVPQAFKHSIAFNCIPQIGGIRDDGFTGEEQKMMEETRKILDLPKLRVNATAVRVPTYSCHGESVCVELERPASIQEARDALRAQPGLCLQDELSSYIYPMGNCAPGSSVERATGRDWVYVGRIRCDPSVENGLNLWVVSDNLRKGAALNAVQIGEMLIKSSH